MNAVPLPPHPKLEKYYTHDAARPGFVDEMFDHGAQSYEWVCRIMSLGTGSMYRRQALINGGLASGMRLLDVATGTGLVLRPAGEVCGETRLTIGLDPSAGMLRECRKQSSAPLVQARGEALPFPDGYFDMVSTGYGLRHVGDLNTLFREYYRVMKPGGRILVLELTQPSTALGRTLNRLFLGMLIPYIARAWRGRAAGLMMNYFWETIETCVPPDTILGAMREAGFPDAARTVSGGILSEYRAVRPL